MSPQAKTIQIYLPQGNPRGIRVSEITTRTVKLIEVPRPRLELFFTMPESRQVGLYFLVGSNEEQNEPKVYIGQTGELRKRLGQHNQDNDWEWERAFVMLSTNNTITQTHALYLEYTAIKTANQVDRYQLANGNSGSLPHTPDPLKADCDELFHTLSILLSTLGQPIFEPLIGRITDDSNPAKASEVTNQNEQNIFYCTGKDASAQGHYSDDGFIILKDSLIRKDIVPSLANWARNERQELLTQSKLIEANDKNYKLADNHLCRTPSGAAVLVLGRPSNGWITWVSEDGKTLDDAYRQTEAED